MVEYPSRHGHHLCLLTYVSAVTHQGRSVLEPDPSTAVLFQGTIEEMVQAVCLERLAFHLARDQPVGTRSERSRRTYPSWECYQKGGKKYEGFAEVERRVAPTMLSLTECYQHGVNMNCCFEIRFPPVLPVSSPTSWLVGGRIAS